MAVINFLCDVGTNAYVLKFAQNNAVVLSPLGIVLFVWFRARAKKTAGTWDDELVKRFGKLFGEDNPTTAGFTPDPPEPPRPGT